MTDTPSLILPDNHEFHDVQRRMEIQGDRAVIRRQQEIPPDFWDRLLEKRKVQDNAPIGDWLNVAEIPCVLVEKWITEGFNIFDKNVTLKEIVRRLHHEGSERLILTKRKI